MRRLRSNAVVPVGNAPLADPEVVFSIRLGSMTLWIQLS